MIKAENLNFGYDSHDIIDRLDFEFSLGELVAVAGPNGVGKSTLLELMCGNFKPRSGKILLDSKPVTSYSHKQLASKLSVVRQEFIPPFGFTVYETVMMARTSHFDMFGFETKKDRDITEHYLDVTGVIHLADRRLDQISGGERQRVFIARALAQETPVMMLDEPTSFLDMKHQVGIYDLLKRMQVEDGKTIVTIIHDINLARQYCDKVLLLGRGGEHILGRPDQIFNRENIKRFYDVDSVSASADGLDIFMPIGKWSRTGE
ncbi:MAG: ABC transporter ATP-binding protein [Sedimentisphaeraceae bacterium JB056]